MDMIRQTAVFDPAKFTDDNRVLVIGVGSTGSALALQLAKMGLKYITLTDDDTVEPHNLCNQVLYGPDDVGLPKVDAAADAIFRLTGKRVDAIQQRITAKMGALKYSHVFCCVDTMTARREILDHCVVGRGYCRWFSDMRMTARTAYAYGFDPTNSYHVDAYRETLHSDDDVPPGAGGCNISTSIGATASICADMAAWQFIDNETGAVKVHESIMDLNNWQLHRRLFPNDDL